MGLFALCPWSTLITEVAWPQAGESGSTMIKTLDLFCGGGGSSYGAQEAGAEIVCGIDLSEVATATYRDSFPGARVVTGNIEDISPRKLHGAIGNIDLILASPECTNHTCAKGAVPRSEQSRATAMQALRFAEEFRPRWLVLENVVHMRPWSRYGELTERLEALGYRLQEFVLDASDFGVAQSRRRLFIVCDRSDAVKPLKATSRTKKTVRHILDKPGKWGTPHSTRRGVPGRHLREPRGALPSLAAVQAFFLSITARMAAGAGRALTDRCAR
jgi:DNA (cytosine-5)-methyltransferase 1